MRESTHKPHRQRVPLPDPVRRRMDAEQPPEPRESDRPAGSIKDTNVVRGDDRPQAVRHSR